MNTVTDDLRIKEIKELQTPAAVIAEVPITEAIAQTVSGCRKALHQILHGADDRLIVVMGPCSIHDTKAAMEYASKLMAYREQYAEDLEIVMRVYFEKPRTTVGWKGLINDPDLDGSFQINKGLRMAREVLLNINSLGLPAVCRCCRSGLEFQPQQGRISSFLQLGHGVPGEVQLGEAFAENRARHARLTCKRFDIQLFGEPAVDDRQSLGDRRILQAAEPATLARQ